MYERRHKRCLMRSAARCWQDRGRPLGWQPAIAASKELRSNDRYSWPRSTEMNSLGDTTKCLSGKCRPFPVTKKSATPAIATS